MAFLFYGTMKEIDSPFGPSANADVIHPEWLP